MFGEILSCNSNNKTEAQKHSTNNEFKLSPLSNSFLCRCYVLTSGMSPFLSLEDKSNPASARRSGHASPSRNSKRISILSGQHALNQHFCRVNIGQSHGERMTSTANYSSSKLDDLECDLMDIHLPLMSGLAEVAKDGWKNNCKQSTPLRYQSFLMVFIAQ